MIREASELLQWDKRWGIGFYPVTEPIAYDDAYFEEYERREHSPMGTVLNRARVGLCHRFMENGTGPARVLDVGVGNGAFLHWRANTVGFDVCPKAVAMLQREGLFLDPYKDSLDGIAGVTFFDSLEHIAHPHQLLERLAGQWLVITLPIFRDKSHALASKHFKPREHYWYFTFKGFVAAMTSMRFALHHVSDFETRAGREDILTFVFRGTRA